MNPLSKLLTTLTVPLIITLTLLVSLNHAATVAAAADVIVTTLTDENDGCGVGDCSLREAIDSAVSGDRVVVPNGTYALTLGEIYINKALTISGTGEVIVTANNSSRLLNIGSSSSVTLTNLTLRDGYTSGNGGAIIVTGGYLTLTQASIYSSSADLRGGGIYLSNGARVLLQSGGIFSNTGNTGGSSVSSAGGVHVADGKFRMDGGEVSWNKSNGYPFPGGGINVDDFGATAVLNGGIIRHNDAYRGGGIIAYNGLIELNGTRIYSNVATYGGGVYLAEFAAYLDMSGGSIEQNRSDTPGNFGGGGIYSFRGTANMSGGSIISNVTNYNGGGAYMRRTGTFTMTGGTIAGNIAGNDGGGLYIAEIDGNVSNGTFADNVPEAIYINSSGTWVVAGSNFNNNGIGIVVNGSVTLDAYANNFISHTLAVENYGTFTGRHNWWGAGATAVSIGNSDAYTYRLGAPVVSWSDTGQLADSNGRNATITAASGSGSGIIVNHGRVAPFGQPIPDSGAGSVPCGDSYDFFVLSGSAGSTWDVTLPVDDIADCNSETALTDQLYHFALAGTAPDTACVTCWFIYSGTITHSMVAPYSLTGVGIPLAAVQGTPFVAGYATAAVAPTLTVTSTNNTVNLSWVTEAGCSYDLYRSYTPYSGFAWVADSTPYQANLSEATPQLYYYVEKDCSGETAVSDTVGAFNWSLTTGS